MRLAARAKCGGEIFSDFLWAVALDKTGRAGARGRGGVRTRFGPENCDAASGTRRPTEAAAKRPAAPGSLGGHLEQPREVDGAHAEDARDVAKLPWAPPKAAGKDKAPGPLFHGRSVLRRVRIARAAAAEEQRRLALQKVGAGALSLEWAMRRLNGRTLRRFGAVWRNVPQSPEPRSSNRGPKLRIGEAEVRAMERASVIFEASKKPTKGLVAPFAVVEEKAAEPRRRFAARPKGENDRDDCGAEAPPLHAPHYLDGVFLRGRIRI
ncbi:hypothetical protein ERJ75_001619800 [Trypanosoma vivax]|nr:hypothetical protein ERJ75_001619800 [Trypanosoma vivax]